MKYNKNVQFLSAASSLPVRGAWVEISRQGNRREDEASLPVRGAWVEILARAAEKL